MCKGAVVKSRGMDALTIEPSTVRLARAIKFGSTNPRQVVLPLTNTCMNAGMKAFVYDGFLPLRCSVGSHPSIEPAVVKKNRSSGRSDDVVVDFFWAKREMLFGPFQLQTPSGA